MRTQLLCTFCKKHNLQETIDAILKTYPIVFDKIFILKNVDNPKELMATYNIDTTNGTPTTMLENTISLHRKKETNTLYTINALNHVIALLNDGKPDPNFPMKWENYKNSILLVNESGLKQIPTEVLEVIKIVREG